MKLHDGIAMAAAALLTAVCLPGFAQYSNFPAYKSEDAPPAALFSPAITPLVKPENCAAAHAPEEPPLPTPPAPKIEPAARYHATEEEIALVAKVAHFEDRTSPESLMAVAEVILNRLEHPAFPDTVSEIVYQSSTAGGRTVRQFSVVTSGSFEAYIPGENELEAVRAVFFGGESVACGALYFAAKYVPPSKISANLYLAADIGASYFWAQGPP